MQSMYNSNNFVPIILKTSVLQNKVQKPTEQNHNSLMTRNMSIFAEQHNIRIIRQICFFLNYSRTGKKNRRQ